MPVNVLVSDSWVQPSQPIPTPTLSSSLSGCLLTHAMPSLFSAQAVAIALSAVGIPLLFFCNELIDIGVANILHHDRPTQPVVHLPSRAGLLSTEGTARMTTVDPRKL